RNVKKGAKAFSILVPCCRKITESDPETGESKERSILYGFTTAAVFAIEATEGATLPVDNEISNWLENLPLIEVAKSWGLTIEAYNGKENGALGKYCYGKAIALGVR